MLRPFYTKYLFINYNKLFLFHSPNNSLVRPYSPKSTTNLAGNYNRPQPPPYISGTNSLHHRKSTIEKTPSTSGHTPEHRTALEESLKLLNEANISDFKTLPADFKNLTSDFKDPIVDINDGTDDYVPIKTDGFVTMKGANSDDIQVPDLTKFMGVGIWHEVLADGQPPVKTWFCWMNKEFRVQA